MLAAKKMLKFSTALVFILATLISLAGHANDNSEPSLANEADNLFLRAKESIRVGDVSALPRFLSALKNYPLVDYLEYWQWREKVIDTRQAIDTPSLQTWLDMRQGTLVADLLRRDWLLRLGKQGDWALFQKQYASWILRDDRDVLCYGLTSQVLSSGVNSDLLARNIRIELNLLKDLPMGCQTLLRESLRVGVLNRRDLIEVLRNVFNNNRIATLTPLSDLVPLYLPFTSNALQFIYEKPAVAIRQSIHKVWDESARELMVLGILRLARENPEQAAELLSEFDKRLNPAQRNYAWGQVGMAGAKRLHENTLLWYLNGELPQIGTEALEWRVRAALRAQRWAMVRESIEAMSDAQRQDPTWIYWLGRAYAMEGKNGQAQTQYQKIASQFNFYGKLALEEMGEKISIPTTAAPVTRQELNAAENNLGLLRALAFYNIGLRFEGNREWNFVLRGMSDRQLLAASEFARRQNIYDRAINTAERTVAEHDFNLRFLTPYRKDLAQATQRTGLDESYVYGLIRQESRFINTARSSVGASGLMQLMPATAKLVAKKLGWENYQAQQVNQIEANLTLGTAYLRMVLDGLDQSAVLAAAGYNAGPGRPKAWQSRFHFNKPIEGAIFAETIPFNETRDYVKKVMSNAVYYASLLEGRTQSLKARLGVIQPRMGNPAKPEE